jgi:DinB family protein
MQTAAFELEALIDQHIATLRAMLKDKIEYKPSPAKWSKKEILGHMVDSAQNNIRRFIVAQYENNPTITYRQDDWVAISHYQDYDQDDLVNLWYLLNKHIVVLLKNLSQQALQRNCQTEALHTIDWLATDYVRHLRHHLHQVLDLEPVAYR